jgi:hypothetical protein
MAMTVRELIERLQQENPDDMVVMSKDAEGNHHSPLETVSQCVYVAETTWFGETYPRELTDDDRADGWSDDDLYDGDNGVNAVHLWPVN